MHITRIGLTPLKGARHAPLTQVLLDRRGPVGDRIFCLVDDPEYDHDDHPEDAVQDLTNMLNVHFKLEEERDINDEG